jgi:hypothetical protein
LSQSLYCNPKLPAKDIDLKKQIEEVFTQHKACVRKRTTIHLGVNKKRILRVMKLFNLSPLRKSIVPVKTDDLKTKKRGGNYLLSTINKMVDRR